MNEYAPQALQWICWELSLFAVGLALAVYATRSRLGDSRDYGAEVICGGLAIKLLLGAAIPQTAVFLGGVSAWSLHWTSTFLGLAAAGGWYRLIKHERKSCEAIWSSALNPPVIFVCAALVLLAPMLSGSLTPILDTDSSIHSHHLLGFINGTVHPFEFQNNYVALWESSYLPSLVLTNSTHLVALTSVQAVILFALASYLLARQLGFDALAAGLIAFTAILCGHLWGSFATGAATLKNDAISAAGVLLMALGAVRFTESGQVDLPIAVLLAGGLIFGSCKFSGPVIASVLGLSLLAFYPRQVLGMNASSWGILAGVLLLFCATSGIYYLRNLWQFGNPVYPFILHIGPFTLPGGSGYYDPVGTRIIDHLSDPQIWKLFFGIGSDASDRTAYLIKTLFAFLLLIPLWLLLVRWLPTRLPGAAAMVAEPRLIWFIWLTTVVLWLLFFSTIWSAGMRYDPYYYLVTHNHLRYAIAHVQLLVILAAVGLFSLGAAGKVLGFGLLAAEALGRYRDLHDGFSWFGVYSESGSAALVIALATATVALIILARARLLPTLASFLLLVAFFAPQIYERNWTRHGWKLFAMDSISAAPKPCSAAILVWPGQEEPLTIKLLPYAFAATGSTLKCSYAGKTTVDQLAQKLSKAQPVPDFVVASIIYGSRDMPDEDVERISARMNGISYHLALRKPLAVAYQSMPPAVHGTSAQH